MKQKLDENDYAKHGFRLELLSPDKIDEALRLCNSCVGENLYLREEIADSIEKDNYYFYVLTDEMDNAIGYIYFYLTTIEEFSTSAKLATEQVEYICQGNNRVIGKIQSVGVRDEYRRLNLSVKLLSFALEKLHILHADIIFIVCWKIGSYIPLAKSLERLHFKYFTDAHKVWYDNEKLICPYCIGRCHCDAAVYYKKPDGEEKNET